MLIIGGRDGAFGDVFDPDPVVVPFPSTPFGVVVVRIGGERFGGGGGFEPLPLDCGVVGGLVVGEDVSPDVVTTAAVGGLGGGGRCGGGGGLRGVGAS